MSEERPRKRKHHKETRENKYAELPAPIDLSKTFALVDVSAAEVEQAGNPDWNAGADPYLRIVGWKRP
ncbi:Uncharacterised protein [Mycobacteroides abscessus subsp. abscessus]|uniref:hypothetical protein n=1 Tax=Mycobacteroides abscessus TaxID=36809 RepID=UPI0009261849|nr:hypothetical protein [Mycobacteroides abscessus]SIC51456.1 Uncharacterised protein [Mycobacteroides abscessus subsp. abscessus]SID08222.1 Uncharacterised protein [Mycobacteroides abscessus subsp. abscessus]SID35238.1 Uncharacterised protein [Mycobacteroides abscessus subsp. abscessus]SID40351.1 Uncharacterised protein [Mycobacteroides abscessus subsp. abscessus]SKT66281.1 Uncharacterised protein [Mycobacteroides abscessus subsp. abscessus]